MRFGLLHLKRNRECEMNMNTDAVATQAYFNAHPAVARADIEAQATANPTRNEA